MVLVLRQTIRQMETIEKQFNTIPSIHDTLDIKLKLFECKFGFISALSKYPQKHQLSDLQTTFNIKG